MARTNTSEKSQEEEASGAVDFEDGEAFTWNMKDTEEDSGPAPIDKGTYLVTIDSVEFKLSKSSGSPMWALVYSLAEGELAEKNRKLFDNISLKAGQEGRVKKFLNRVAPELAELENFNPKKCADEGLLVGKQMKVKVDIEEGTAEYPGKRNRVKDYYTPSGGGGASGGGFSM